MDELLEPPRILPGDALTLLLEDLVAAAPGAALTVDGFCRWFASSVDLLACVPHEDQRLSWAYCLAQPLSGHAEWKTNVLGEFMRFAEEVRRCRLDAVRREG